MSLEEQGFKFSDGSIVILSDALSVMIKKCYQEHHLNKLADKEKAIPIGEWYEKEKSKQL